MPQILSMERNFIEPGTFKMLFYLNKKKSVKKNEEHAITSNISSQ